MCLPRFPSQSLARETTKAAAEEEEEEEEEASTDVAARKHPLLQTLLPYVHGNRVYTLYHPVRPE